MNAPENARRGGAGSAQAATNASAMVRDDTASATDTPGSRVTLRRSDRGRAVTCGSRDSGRNSPADQPWDAVASRIAAPPPARFRKRSPPPSGSEPLGEGPGCACVWRAGALRARPPQFREAGNAACRSRKRARRNLRPQDAVDPKLVRSFTRTGYTTRFLTADVLLSVLSAFICVAESSGAGAVSGCTLSSNRRLLRRSSCFLLPYRWCTSSFSHLAVSGIKITMGNLKAFFSPMNIFTEECFECALFQSN